MAGIVSYGAYIPIYRLAREHIWLAWGGLPIPGESAIANFDEDSITMAVEAGNNCLRGFNKDEVDAVFLASATTPYLEKQSASIVAEALDLRRGVRTADFTNSLRSATIAIQSALDAVQAGSAKNVLVIAADCRVGHTATADERSFGDGAAAVLIGKTQVIANISAYHTHHDDIMYQWRLDGDRFVRSWEDRFIIQHGYQDNLIEAVKDIMAKTSLKAADFAKAVFFAYDTRRQQTIAKKLGFDVQAQLQDSLFSTVGNTGTAYALMMLIGALEEAKDGDKILLANYGDGADAFVMDVAGGIAKVQENRRGIKYHIQSKMPLPSYTHYLRYRGLIEGNFFFENQSAATVQWRDRKWNIGCRGEKCLSCGNINLPPQRICMYCQSKDNFEDITLSDRRGKLFTFSKDSLGPTLDPPIILSIMDFDEGGRFYAQMTDRDPEKIEVGMPLELTFRWMHSERGIRNYYWKCRPLRGD